MLSLWFDVPGWIRELADVLQVDAAELMRKLLLVALIWVLSYLAIQAVGLIARRIEKVVGDGDGFTLSEREQRGRTVSQLLRSVGRVALLAFAVLLTLNVFIDIRPILAGAGILGLAVSFGAQSLVKDVISGFFYLLEGQFVVGDVIEIAGKSGVVERMTLRLVVLRDVHGTVHLVPNGQITTVSNKTRDWSRAVLDLGIGYGTPVDMALSVFRDEATRFSEDPNWRGRIDGEPEIAGVNEFGDSAVTIRTLIRTRPGQQWAVEREFRRRIKNRLDREGIEIPFPQRTVHFRTVIGAGGAGGSEGVPDGVAPPSPPSPRDSRAVPPDSSES